MHTFRILLFALLAIATFDLAAASSIEDYGNLPSMDLVRLSPSGKRLAFRRTSGGTDLVLVLDLEARSRVGGVNITGIGARDIEFLTEDQLIIKAGRTMRARGFRGAWDHSAAFSYDLKSEKIYQLLTRLEQLYTAQSGLGRIAGFNASEESLYMPAYTIEPRAAAPSFSLVEVRLDKNGRARIRERGTVNTIDWFVDEDGKALLREDMDNDRDVYRIHVYRDGKREKLYESEGEFKSISIVGLTQDREHAVVTGYSEKTEGRTYFLLSLATGELSESILGEGSAEVERVIIDVNRIVYGVQFAGFKPSYAFFDDDLNKWMESVTTELGDTAVQLESWSEDFSQLVVHVSGGWHSGGYYLLEKGKQATQLGLDRPGIDNSLVAPTEITAYPARDGLEIPALVTVKADVRAGGNAPLVVLPHGGPEAHDRFEFDWLSQYLASQGYVVLQPQFRGSDGFGVDFTLAGYGEWGGKMQTDLDDGVSWLIESGLVNPDRVCIVGASYGGYAALAAASFASTMYSCAASINGVTDLQRMLKEEISGAGRDHWVVAYWQEQFGADVGEREELRAISPVRHADKVDVPVLLIHGNKDTVVPVEQSRAMNRALKKAGKSVEYREIKGEDHWLSYGETRLETLRILDAFLKTHL